MHIADVTMFHAPASGGVRTYLQAKHRVLSRTPNLRTSCWCQGLSVIVWATTTRYQRCICLLDKAIDSRCAAALGVMLW